MRVQDSFTTYQGTGHLLGMRQHFVRLAGCSVACPIRSVCDEPRALTVKGARDVEPAVIVAEAIANVGPRGWLHITGGEPTDQPDALQELARLARRAGLYVHLQTSGVRRAPIQWDWITVSPKERIPVQDFGQELVLVDDGSWSVRDLSDLVLATSFWNYYLQPLDAGDGIAWGPTLELIREVGDPWMITTQLHKSGGFR